MGKGFRSWKAIWKEEKGGHERIIRRSTCTYGREGAASVDVPSTPSGQPNTHSHSSSPNNGRRREKEGEEEVLGWHTRKERSMLLAIHTHDGRTGRM